MTLRDLDLLVYCETRLMFSFYWRGGGGGGQGEIGISL